MVGHLLRDLRLAAVSQVLGDAGGPGTSGSRWRAAGAEKLDANTRDGERRKRRGILSRSSPATACRPTTGPATLWLASSSWRPIILGMTPTTFAVLAALTIAILFPTVASAAGASTGEQVATKGSSAGAPPCSSCHGPEGQGQPAAGFPRISGMDAKYLARQLAGFAAGTRANPVMSPIAKLLTPSEASKVAAYYAAIPAVKQAGEAPAKPAPSEGMRLAVKGDWNIGLPACAQCHGPQGLGVGSSFPPLAGQSSAYLAAQLAAFKAGTRKDDPLGLMQGIAKRLGDTQARAVSEFYAALPVVAGSPSKGKP